MTKSVDPRSDGVLNDAVFGQSPAFIKRPRAQDTPRLESGVFDLADAPVTMAEKATAAVPSPAKVAEVVEPVNITWAQAAGRPEVRERLDRLPPEVAFGDDFPEPIHYDAEQRMLVYRGFMSSMSYRYLRSVSRDLVYLAALDELNVKSSMVMLGGPAAHGHRLGWAVGTAVAAGLGGAAWAVIHWVH